MHCNEVLNFSMQKVDHHYLNKDSATILHSKAFPGIYCSQDHSPLKRQATNQMVCEKPARKPDI